MLNPNDKTAELPQAEQENSMVQIDETVEFSAEETPQTQATQSKTEEKPKEYWYQKLGRSVGASIGVAACSLAIVSLAAGFSAFAGTQAGTAAHGADRPAMEQTFERGQDGMNFKQGGDRGMNSDSGEMDSLPPSDKDNSSDSSSTQDNSKSGGKSNTNMGQNSGVQGA